jgi:hypothetical protein
MRHHLVSAGLFSSALFLCAQEAAYSSAVYGDRDPCGRAFAALDHQTYDVSICGVDRATACSGPCGIIHLKVGFARPLGNRIPGDVCARSVWNDCVQWESSKSDSRTIGFCLFVQMDTSRFRQDFLMGSNIIDGLAFYDINKPIKYAFFWKEFEPFSVQKVSSPLVYWNVNGGNGALMESTSGQEFSDDMTGRQENTVLVQEESTPIDLSSRGADTNDGAHRLLDRLDRSDKLIVAFGDTDRSGGNNSQKDQYTGNQTSGTIDGSVVKPFSNGCQESSTSRVWDVKCPKETEDLHRVILPPSQ